MANYGIYLCIKKLELDVRLLLIVEFVGLVGLLSLTTHSYYVQNRLGRNSFDKIMITYNNYTTNNNNPTNSTTNCSNTNTNNSTPYNNILRFVAFDNANPFLQQHKYPFENRYKILLENITSPIVVICCRIMCRNHDYILVVSTTLFAMVAVMVLPLLLLLLLLTLLLVLVLLLICCFGVTVYILTCFNYDQFVL